MAKGGVTWWRTPTHPAPHSDGQEYRLTLSAAWRSRTSAQMGKPTSCLCRGEGWRTPLWPGGGQRAGLGQELG